MTESCGVLDGVVVGVGDSVGEGFGGEFCDVVSGTDINGTAPDIKIKDTMKRYPNDAKADFHRVFDRKPGNIPKRA